MSDAPKRIFTWPSYGEEAAAGVWGVTRYPEYAVEYIRADLYEALQARVAELEAERADCDKYLKPDETPRQRMDRDHADVLSLMKLLEREKYKLEAARDKALEDAAKVADARAA